MREVLVVGGGAAGLAAAIACHSYGRDVLLVEREHQLGGILNQCIHNGFGLDVFHEEYTGPEYAYRFIEKAKACHLDIVCDTTVIDINKYEDGFVVRMSSEKTGIQDVYTKTCLLTTGSYERSRGHISIPGDRPYGVLTAGQAQRYLNQDGYMVGKRVFILGSGDIGLIMARRMRLEGAEVLGVAERLPFSNGLTRNIVQCLNDFDIPLYLSHTVTSIQSDEHQRLKSIELSTLDSHFQPIIGSERLIEVDTLLLSVGLIPDVSLITSLGVEMDQRSKSVVVDQTYQTTVDGLFVSGNALHIHDLVDHVTLESERVAKHIDDYLTHGRCDQSWIQVIPGKNVGAITPQRIQVSGDKEEVIFSFRATKKIKKASVVLLQNKKVIFEKKRQFIVPAEMETIEISLDSLSSNHALVVNLEVER